MLRLPITACLSAFLVSLAPALPTARMAPLPDALPKAYPLGPAFALTDSLVVGRWEINSADLGDREDPRNRARIVIHFTPDHAWEMHGWSMFADSGDPGPEYNGFREYGTWSVRDTVIGMMVKGCEGLNPVGARECDIMKSHEGFGHDTDWSVVKPREGKRLLVDKDLDGMLAFPYRGPDRDIAAPSFWTSAASVRPRAGGFPRRTGITPGGSGYDILGREPAAMPSVTSRFRKPGPAERGGS